MNHHCWPSVSMTSAQNMILLEHCHNIWGLPNQKQPHKNFLIEAVMLAKLGISESFFAKCSEGRRWVAPCSVGGKGCCLFREKHILFHMWNHVFYDFSHLPCTNCTMYNVSSFWSSILCVSKNILGFYLAGYQRFIIFIFLIRVSWVSNSRPSGWILNCFAHISVEKTMQARPRPIPDDGENT